MPTSHETLSGTHHGTAVEAAQRVSGLGAWIRRFGAALAAHYRAAAEIQQLHHFTDMELRDIGLNRGDLPAIAKGTYRRD